MRLVLPIVLSALTFLHPALIAAGQDEVPVKILVTMEISGMS